jgi:cell division protein ZapA
MSNDTLDITLQGREYHVACQPAEREALLRAVSYLDAKMAEIARQTRSSGERLAVMTALNLAHELLAAHYPGEGPTAAAFAFDSAAIEGRIKSIEARLDAALNEQQDQLF